MADDTQDDIQTDAPPAAGERIAKRLARAGVCSRRDAERWIAEGRVMVNGKVLTSPAVLVKPGDAILVDKQPIAEDEPSRVWRYHKPKGLVTSARDEKGRPTVFERLPETMPRVVSVGRLDLTTEGLLLLTNDGTLARFLELPSTGWARRYRVRVHGTVEPEHLAALARGVTVSGIDYGPIEATLDRAQGSNAWLTVTLREGKNREIRLVMESLGLTVNRLIRVAYGPFQLGKLAEGEVEEIPRRVLKDQLVHYFADPAAAARTAEGGRKAPAKRPARRPAPKAAAPKPAASKAPADKPTADKPTVGRPAPAKPAGRPAARPAPADRPTGRPGRRPPRRG